MSNRVLFLNKGFISENAPLRNGLGRFVPQLARITLKFCKERPSSLGVRKFIEHDIVKFAEKNPHVVVYLKPRRLRMPVIVAEYLNGERHWQALDKFSREDVAAWIDLYRTHSGKEYQIQTKFEHTLNPSIQGMWNSYTNVDPKIALAKFPTSDLSRPFGLGASASEKLIQMFKEQKEAEKAAAALEAIPVHEQAQLEREKQ